MFPPPPTRQTPPPTPYPPSPLPLPLPPPPPDSPMNLWLPLPDYLLYLVLIFPVFEVTLHKIWQLISVRPSTCTLCPCCPNDRVIWALSKEVFIQHYKNKSRIKGWLWLENANIRGLRTSCNRIGVIAMCNYVVRKLYQHEVKVFILPGFYIIWQKYFIIKAILR